MSKICLLLVCHKALGMSNFGIPDTNLGVSSSGINISVSNLRPRPSEVNEWCTKVIIPIDEFYTLIHVYIHIYMHACVPTYLPMHLFTCASRIHLF